MATHTRMETGMRREQLLQTGMELLRHRPTSEVSVEEIAAAAGVSKGLLYHYFPTKKDFILAALEREQEQLAESLAPDPSLRAQAQLEAGLDAFLTYVEEHAAAYTLIFSGRAGDSDISETLRVGRSRQMETLLDGLTKWEDAPVEIERGPALETAVLGWLYFVEGAILRWLERRDLDRDDLHSLLFATFASSVEAAITTGDRE